MLIGLKAAIPKDDVTQGKEELFSSYNTRATEQQEQVATDGIFISSQVLTFSQKPKKPTCWHKPEKMLKVYMIKKKKV